VGSARYPIVVPAVVGRQSGGVRREPGQVLIDRPVEIRSLVLLV
jgi:hypothetical protein